MRAGLSGVRFNSEAHRVGLCAGAISEANMFSSLKVIDSLPLSFVCVERAKLLPI